MKSTKALQNQKIAQKQREKQAKIERKIRVTAFCHRMSLVYNPSAALTFVAIYWAVGLKNAQFY